MGLLRAATTSVASGFGDQFKEFVTCPTIEKNVLYNMVKVIQTHLKV